MDRIIILKKMEKKILKITLERKMGKLERPSANEHIGSMAALPPLENVYEIGSLSPAGKYLEAATAPICQNVRGNAGKCSATWKRKRQSEKDK
jgi:hypothetical protein